MRAVNRRRFASFRSIFALMLREMQTTYGRSPGGYIWALLEPVAGIALLTIIFSIGFRAPPLGPDFAPFYASGIVPFLFFTAVSTKVSQSIQFSRQLLAYPSVTFVDAILARILVNTMTQAIVGYVVFTGVLVFYDMRGSLDFAAIILSFAMTAALATGVGTLNCFLILKFPVWQIIWAILTRPLFLISCIFFLFDGIPQPYQDWLWFNPLVHVVGVMRSGFYASYDASYASVAYVMAISMIGLVVGLLFLLRYHRDLLDR
ncbi:ABC transporter permease [Jannaschia pohangensis]|uniref:ABC transporter permease n=1 Tax=Jannaschia pohangensis TaxID=390807 RepID=UPI002481BD80|nr:ABC transporter permease [Jannaschia pohangensis]